jgi:glycosyltransferase involved in cell wall biosynthesis
MGSHPDKDRWLLISYAANMEASACSQHIDDKLGPLQEQGIEPLLLSSICGATYTNIIHATVFSLSPSGLRNDLRYLLRRRIAQRPLLRLIETLLLLPLLPFYLLEEAVSHLENEWSWQFAARVRGLALVRKYRPSLIYSTGGPVCAHLAASYIARKTGLPWIADLQDPLIHDKDDRKSARAARYHRALEKHIRHHADATIFTTDAHRLNSNKRTGVHTRGYAIYPGADPKVMPGSIYRSGSHCRLAHFGSMGGTRNLSVLLPAIESVIDRHPEYRDIIRLDLYGNCDRLSRNLIAAAAYPEITRFHGKVPRDTALRAMLSTDCLLIIQNTEHLATETFPAKIYDYFFTGRPILALVHDNPEFEQLLGCGRSFIAPADEVDKVAHQVKKLVTAHLAGELADSKPCFRWTSSRAVEQLRAIARTLGQPNAD